MSLLCKAMESKRGFTLVEGIVVAAITAILAAVAIPMYLGFQVDTRHKAVDQLAQLAAAEADGYYRKTTNDPVLTDLNLYYDREKYTVTVTAPNVEASMIGYSDYKKTIQYR